MTKLWQDVYYRALEAPSLTWAWFNTLNREEWLVVLVVVCATGFVALLGFQTRRI